MEMRQQMPTYAKHLQLPSEVQPLLCLSDDMSDVYFTFQSVADVRAKKLKIRKGYGLITYIQRGADGRPPPWVHNYFLSFGCVEMELVVAAPVYSPNNVFVLLKLIIYQANDGGVICILGTCHTCMHTYLHTVTYTLIYSTYLLTYLLVLTPL